MPARDGCWRSQQLQNMHGRITTRSHGKRMVDTAKHPEELPLKEALHILLTPAEERVNRKIGLEITECWMAAPRKQETRTKLRHTTTSSRHIPGA